MLCTLQRICDQYADVPAVAVAVGRIIASLSVHVQFHADIFAAGKSTSLHCDVEMTDDSRMSHAVFVNENCTYYSLAIVIVRAADIND